MNWKYFFLETRWRQVYSLMCVLLNYSVMGVRWESFSCNYMYDIHYIKLYVVYVLVFTGF